MLEVKNLTVSYTNKKFLSKPTYTKAVEDVSFQIAPGKILGLVGESGCGKSTLGRAILKLVGIQSGDIDYNGKSIHKLKKDELLSVRKQIQVIFQDPYSSLNPRLTVGEIITEGLLVHHKGLSKKERDDKAKESLAQVNLPESILTRYPHEFSGGQRQRIAIARALILRPELVICDEAVSALDISTQAQVVNNLLELRDRFHLSYLFISHDLNIVNHISDEIAVMYLGKIVEIGKKEKIINHPLHPYTKALFSASFDIKKRNSPERPLVGEIPSIINKPSGCYFHTRCPNVQDICKKERPLEKTISTDQKVACHFPLQN
ncbi:ABC transporter ATP-binding protein [Leptospira ilyithenensis]|uniref:ABC transporter ATP-binding protein n=1 Tax=Leptospira ilyithenensis TaxID=2484901 RepID=A0A4R9LIY8_9LEPT|nr:ABC transporter ATP-binding protein [Leptospira ilyithenensis]TGN06572.1 ABC transporter ATP-binding protein [Leptospira ilyithenensis]